MKISFGNAFHIYCNNVDKAPAQNFITTEASSKGASINRVYAELKEDMFGGIKKEPIDGQQAFFKDIIVVEENPELSDRIKNYCNYFGIQYSEFENNSLKQIKERMIIPVQQQEAKIPYFLEMVDVEKLDKLLQNQGSNFDHVESNWKKYFQEDTNFIIKSQEKIPAPVMHVTSRQFGDVDELRNYVQRYGSGSLNKDSFYILLTESGSQKNHALYFALKDMGMKEIPVVVNKDAKEILNILGIIK